MLQIKTNGEHLDLPSGFGMEIEENNPIFNERGTQSLPATVPATRRNIRLLDAPHRLDTASDPNAPQRSVDVVDGALMRRGTVNVTEASRGEGITFNVGFDNSTAYAKWAARKLSELSGLPTYQAEEQIQPVGALMAMLWENYTGADPKNTPFAVFPVAIAKEEDPAGPQSSQKYWEVLNVPTANSLWQPTTVKRIIENEITDVSVPEAYMVSPFLRVHTVLEFVFKDLGLSIIRNPFREDPDLCRLVVLNNAADSCCRGVVNAADLLPDATVEEFLNSLWVRFGLVYNIDAQAGTAQLELLKDILAQGVHEPLDYYAAGFEKVIYNAKQYVKLSAATSLEGAEPATERYEDFVRGVNIDHIHLGTDVNRWVNDGDHEQPDWDGDTYYGLDYQIEDPEPDEWEDNPDDPYDDPDDDRDDGRNDYDEDFWADFYYSMRSPRRSVPTRAGATDTNGEFSSETFLAREFITGRWFRLDARNSKTQLSSSSFFNWDPQPEDCEALELTSVDECVPVGYYSYTGEGSGEPIRNLFSGYIPFFLCGSRHYHSYIKGSDKSENAETAETPLAFMFAYTVNGKTIGRSSPEDENGQTYKCDGGFKPTVTLLFQFADGLFAKYWSRYDEILRHGNRSVEVPARFNKIYLNDLNLFKVFQFKGIRCLIDKMNYNIPSGREAAVEMTLRTIQTQGSYDIKAEQNVPDFMAAGRHLVWTLYRESYGNTLDTPEAKRLAMRNYAARTGYVPHVTSAGEQRDLSPESELLTLERIGVTWQTDKSLTEPTNHRQRITRTYKARLTYDIYEQWLVSVSGPDEIETWERCPDPIDTETIEVSYKVWLYPRWEKD